MNVEQPEPPTNVRLVYADDHEVPLDCRYDGLDDEGQHVWTAVVPSGTPLVGIRSVQLDELPARTTVQLEAAED